MTYKDIEYQLTIYPSNEVRFFKSKESALREAQYFNRYRVERKTDTVRDCDDRIISRQYELITEKPDTDNWEGAR